MKEMKMEKKTIFSKIALLSAIILVMMGSCRREKVDISDLLATVPSSSGMVVGLNVKSLLEKTDCKVEGSTITPGKELKKLLDEGQGFAIEAARVILNGESGIDPVGAIFFTDAYNSYMTFALADTDKFKNFIEEQTGAQFTVNADNVSICGNTAFKGGQGWVCLTSYNTIDAKAVSNYATLSPTQSFVQNPYSANIATMTDDIVGWGEIKSMVKNMVSYPYQSSINLILGFAFEDASALSFDVDFDKGEMETHAIVLNGKGKPAKFLISGKKIDEAIVSGLCETADVAVAMTITSDIVKKFENLSSLIGKAMTDQIVNCLKPIDGTVAAAFSDPELEENLRIAIATDGSSTMELMNVLSAIGSTRKEDKLVYVSKGTMNGGLDMKKVADKFDDGIMGAAFYLPSISYDNVDNLKHLHALYFTLKPESGGVKCEMEITSTESKKNFLLSLLSDFSY